MPDLRLLGTVLFPLGLLVSSASVGAATEPSKGKKVALDIEVAW